MEKIKFKDKYVWLCSKEEKEQITEAIQAMYTPNEEIISAMEKTDAMIAGSEFRRKIRKTFKDLGVSDDLFEEVMDVIFLNLLEQREDTNKTVNWRDLCREAYYAMIHSHSITHPAAVKLSIRHLKEALFNK